MSATELKKRVLHLAAAHPADRAWILARLAPAARTRVATLLRELDALGIRDYAPWVRALDAPQPAPAADVAMPAGDAGLAPWAALLSNDTSLAIDEQLRLDALRGPVETTTPATPLPPAMRRALRDIVLAGNPAA